MPLVSPYLLNRRIALTARHIRGTVVDVGCGTGDLARYVPPDQYVGYDISSEQLAEARRRYPSHRFTDTMPDGHYDTATMVAVLEHLEDPDAVVHAAAQAADRIVATTPSPGFDWVHKVAAYLGMINKDAHHDHKDLLGQEELTGIGERLGLRTTNYERFLGGMNQLVVWEA